MLRVVLVSATIGAAIGWTLLGVAVCCFAYVPWGRTVYAVLWPTSQLVPPTVDSVRPDRWDNLVFALAFANAIPYGLVGGLLHAVYRRIRHRRRC